MRTRPYHQLQRRWRRQIAARLSRRSIHRRRDAGAVGFLVDGYRTGGLVELPRVLLVVVYDEPAAHRRWSIGVRAYRATRVQHGVLWGGAENARLRKDLALCPRPGGKGPRINSRNVEFLDLALRLDHRIEQAVRLQPSAHNRQFRLPRIWAGFGSADAAQLAGEGPEFEEVCQWYRLPAQAAFEQFRRSQDGLALYPLDWVSGQLDDSLALYAELEGMPRRQAFQLSELPRDLAGHQGAMAYDFFSGNPRRRPRGHACSMQVARAFSA
jgi:hypothetical protein